MKRLALFILSGTFLLSTGCGQRAFVAETVPGFNSQPRLAAGQLSPPTQPVQAQTPTAPVVVTSPLDDLEANLRKVALHGPVVQDLATLGADLDAETSYGLMATPESTQLKAVTHARNWASDAEQLYLGWGFKWMTFVGQSRHVFWSPRKKKLLTLDYGYWGSLKHEFETESRAMTYGGDLVRQMLREPRDVYAFNGKEAFQRAKKAGLEAPTQGAIKAILLDAYIVGPHWVFFDYKNQPVMLVDANDGNVISNSRILDILKYLF